MTARNYRAVSQDEWHAEGTKLFGENMMDWRFRCPVCGHVAQAQAWADVGATQSAGFSCIGRWLEGSKAAFEEKGEGPCTYAGGGLFRLNPVKVSLKEGGTVDMFEFAPRPWEKSP